MKRYIKISALTCVFLGILVVVAASFFLFSNAKLQDVRQTLRTLAETIRISEIPPDTDYDTFAKNIAATSSGLRVTLIRTSGTVVGDSQAEAGVLENHLERQEVREALNEGYGEAMRTSETTGVRTLYVSERLGDSLILRLSYPVSSSFAFLKTMLPVVLVLCAVILILINFFTERFSRRLIFPLEEINMLLETQSEDVLPQEERQAAFPEVAPILKNIEYLIRKLNFDYAEIIRTQQMRSDFVANVSHELKSPLTSIKGFAELMSSGLITSPDRQRDYLQRIVSESDRLLNIINDILHLSEVENVKADPAQLEQVDLSRLTFEVFQSLESLAAGKCITLTCSGNGTVAAKAKEMWELIYNLVDNSIKYGQECGYVKVLISSQEGGVSLSVSDDGIGIPEEHLSRVFERFYRVDKSRSRKSGGTGLGLSIVRNIAVKYKGTVSIDSHLGKGTKITVRFDTSGPTGAAQS